jgi:voltage-gated potassium channel
VFEGLGQAPSSRELELAAPALEDEHDAFWTAANDRAACAALAEVALEHGSSRSVLALGTCVDRNRFSSGAAVLVRGRTRMTCRLSPGMAGPEPANANPNRVADESRLERRLDRAVARATTPRGAAIVIATVSTVITVGAGLLMTLVDSETFPSVGSGLWWGVQTVTTVGYGDSVPTNLSGRLVAALVMLLGIGFLTVITASITSTFVSRSRHEPSDAETAIAEQLRQLDSRLERIEAALSRSSSP